MDKKNIILIVILAVVVIFYFQIMEYLGFYEPAQETQQPIQDTTTTVVSPADSSVPLTTGQIPVEQQPISPTTGQAADAAMPPDSVSHDTIIVNTNTYTVTMTSFGGGPISLILNKYKYRDKTPIEMLPEATAATPEATFAGGTFSASQINYRSNVPPGQYQATSTPLEIVYTYATGDGGEIVKRYTFYPDDYHFDLVFQINGREQFGFERKYNIGWNTPLGVTEPQADQDYDAMEAVAMMSGSRETLDDFDDGRLNQLLVGNTEWAGLRSKYFAVAIIPRNRQADGAFAQGVKSKITTPDGSVEVRRIVSGMEMSFANISSLSDSFTVFVGPLDYTLMSSYDVGLEDVLGIGTTPFIGWIIKPFAIGIIWLLPRLYDFVPNYGLVIILFALLIKVVTMPLSMRSFKSMQAMKDLQPKIEEMKKKHKKNPQALNAEMMKMYKAHGVNPISGCLPIIPQMPLFFALFSVFRQTILLRDAPFIWFITDLSRGASGLTDPYIILVILMIAAQFVSQKMTMTSTQQNKALMYVMPLFMGFLFYRFASGLVLYWACFSIFSLLDYAAFKRNKNQKVITA